MPVERRNKFYLPYCYIQKTRKEIQYKQRIAEDKINLNSMITNNLQDQVMMVFLLVANILLQIQFCSRVTEGMPWVRSAGSVVFGVVYEVQWTESGLNCVSPVTFVHKIQELSRANEGK